MNSFTLISVGNLARDPELTTKDELVYARFCLVGNDYTGRDEEGAAREVVTSLWFTAFGPLAEAIARHCRTGDQLILEAHVRANQWTDSEGDRQYSHSFIVDAFKFGAPGRLRRAELQNNGAPSLNTPAREE